MHINIKWKLNKKLCTFGLVIAPNNLSFFSFFFLFTKLCHFLQSIYRPNVNEALLILLVSFSVYFIASYVQSRAFCGSLIPLFSLLFFQVFLPFFFCLLFSFWKLISTQQFYMFRAHVTGAIPCSVCINLILYFFTRN